MNNKRLLNGLKGLNVIINIMNIFGKKVVPSTSSIVQKRKGINKYKILMHKLAKYKNYHHHFIQQKTTKLFALLLKRGLYKTYGMIQTCQPFFLI